MWPDVAASQQLPESPPLATAFTPQARHKRDSSATSDGWKTTDSISTSMMEVCSSPTRRSWPLSRSGYCTSRLSAAHRWGQLRAEPHSGPDIANTCMAGLHVQHMPATLARVAPPQRSHVGVQPLGRPSSRPGLPSGSCGRFRVENPLMLAQRILDHLA